MTDLSHHARLVWTTSLSHLVERLALAPRPRTERLVHRPAADGAPSRN
jgi:hypothetical protein